MVLSIPITWGKCRLSNSGLDLLNPSLYFNKLTRQFLHTVDWGSGHCSLASERHCTALLGWAYLILIKAEIGCVLPS